MRVSTVASWSCSSVISLLVAVVAVRVVPAIGAEAECHLDGTCDAVDSCRLYLAEPSPGAWGIFAGETIPADTLLPLVDVQVPIVDRAHHAALQHTLWNTTVPTSSLLFHTDASSSIATSVEYAACQPHPRLAFQGCRDFDEPARIYANTGAASAHQHCTYKATESIAVGAELLGHCLATVTGNSDTEFASIVTAEWLATHGFCIDHLQVLEQGLRSGRTFTKGETVAIAPVAALSRDELVMVVADVATQPHVVHWKGHQLLLNYCFGHASSSTLLYNYLTPGIKSMYSAGPEFPANVGIRWSSIKMKPEALDQDPSDLLNSNGLVMEFYALTDLTDEHQLVLDYGEAVHKAWEEHADMWKHSVMVNNQDYVSANQFASDCDEEVLISHKCMNKVPSWIEIRCSVDETEKLEVANTKWLNRMLEGTWKKWAAPSGAARSVPCNILGLDDEETYRVQVQEDSSLPIDAGVKIRNAPRASIQYVDKPYTGNQFLRKAFRHEIQLSEEMIPTAWRDLAIDPENKCELYMAESAIPFSGLGMYTAKTIKEGERIFYGEVIINAEDVELNVKLRHWMDGEVYFNEKEWLLYHYYWDSSVATSMFDAMSVQTIIPGLGMLANSHTGLVNSQHRYPTRQNYLNRFRDPGAGCFTTYHDMHYDATMEIEAGAELYVAYGDEWFEGRENLGVIPLSYDFELADEAINLISKIMNQTGLEGTDAEKVMVQDALKMFKNITSTRDRLAQALPTDVEAFQRALSTSTADLTVPNRVRSIPWLEENGRCLDNIRPKKSTVKQAGQGAFATRRLQKGQVIAPMPLVHLRRRHMHIYDSSDHSYEDPNAEIFLDDTQLLINYCFGHPTSSLLLFPYSPGTVIICLPIRHAHCRFVSVVNYINHNLESPNAELRWSSLPNHQLDWLSRTPDSLEEEDHTGLIMEVVATREIQPDEEIFISYGEPWDSGWKQYVNDWEPETEGSFYASSEELNANTEWIRTQEESYPFANHGELTHVCFVFLGDPIEGQKGTYIWQSHDLLYDQSEYAWQCEIVAIEENKSHPYFDAWDRKDSVAPVDLNYTVVIDFDDGEDRKAKVLNVPRKAIRIIDTRYHSDNYKRGAFRHAMHLPDHMFPAAWRDLTQ